MTSADSSVEIPSAQNTNLTNRKLKKSELDADITEETSEEDDEDIELNSKLGIKKMQDEQKTKQDYKTSLQTLVIFLCAAINFGK